MAKAGERPPILLSAILRQAPQLFAAHKLSVVSRYITHLDLLPRHYQGAQSVLLSRNSLRSLQGIQQFPAARTVSLAANLLEAYDDLAPLIQGCPDLEALSLEGNPLSSLPNYRSHLIMLMPNLKSLDGRAVTEEERTLAHQAVDREQAYLAVLLTNACAVHKMARVLLQTQLHMELTQLMHSARLLPQERSAVDPHKLLALWDYEGGLSPQERGMIEGALRREVMREHRRKRGEGGAPSWDAAFSQVLLSQQQTMAQLLELLHRAKHAANQVLQPPGPVIAALRSADQERKNAAQQDREQLVHELRDAYQQLSPGGRIASPAKSSPHARSPQALRDRIQHKLYHVTKDAKPADAARVQAGTLQEAGLEGGGTPGGASGSARSLSQGTVSSSQRTGRGSISSNKSPSNSRRSSEQGSMAPSGRSSAPLSRSTGSIDTIDTAVTFQASASASVRSSAAVSQRQSTQQPAVARLAAQRREAAAKLRHSWAAPQHEHSSRPSSNMAGASQLLTGQDVRPPVVVISQDVAKSSQELGSSSQQLRGRLINTPRYDVPPHAAARGHAEGQPIAASASDLPPQNADALQPQQQQHLQQEQRQQVAQQYLASPSRAYVLSQPSTSQSPSWLQAPSPLPWFEAVPHGSAGQQGQQQQQQEQALKLAKHMPEAWQHQDNNVIAMPIVQQVQASVKCTHSNELHRQAAVPNPQYSHAYTHLPSEVRPAGTRSSSLPQAVQLQAVSSSPRAAYVSETQVAPPALITSMASGASSASAHAPQPDWVQMTTSSLAVHPGSVHQSMVLEDRHVAGIPAAYAESGAVDAAGPSGLQQDGSFANWHHQQGAQPEAYSTAASSGAPGHLPFSRHQHGTQPGGYSTLVSSGAAQQHPSDWHQRWQTEQPNAEQQGWRGSSYAAPVSLQQAPQGAITSEMPGAESAGDADAMSTPLSELRIPHQAHHRPSSSFTFKTPEQQQPLQQQVQVQQQGHAVSELQRLQQDAQQHLEALQQQLESPTRLNSPSWRPRSAQPPTPSTAGTRASMEQEARLAGENAALRQALLQEQDEVRLLQQELEEQQRAAEQMAESLDEAQQEVKDVRLVADRETEELARALVEAKQDHEQAMLEQQQRYEQLIADLQQKHATGMARQQQEHEQAVASLQQDWASTLSLQLREHEEALAGQAQHAQQQLEQQQSAAQQQQWLAEQQLQQQRQALQARQAEHEAAMEDARLAAETSREAEQAMMQAHQQQLQEVQAQAEHRQQQSRQELEQTEEALAAKQDQLMEAHTQVERLMDSLLVQQEAQARLEEELRLVKQHCAALVAQRHREQEQEELALEVAAKGLLQRAWFTFRQAVVVSQQQRAEVQAADRLHAWHVKHEVMRRWTQAVQLGRAYRLLSCRVDRGVLVQCFAAWQAYCRMRRWKAIRQASAEQHNQLRLRLRAFLAWEQYVQHIRAVAQGQVPAELHMVAFQLRRKVLLRRVFDAWRDHHIDHLEPKLFSRRRADRLRARTLLVHAWRAWQTFIPRTQDKRARDAWLHHRRLASLLRSCWSAWLNKTSRARAVRVAAALARRRHAAQLLTTWHQEARRSVHLRRGALKLAALQRLHCLQHAIQSWLHCVDYQRHKQQRLQLAFEHWRLHQLMLAFWSWHQVTQRSTQQLQQAHGLAVHQRSMQATVRWYCLSQALRRQQLQQHWAEQRARSAQTSACRTILRAWASLSANHRAAQQAARTSAAVVFCDAWLLHYQHSCMAKAFHAWLHLCSRTVRQAASRSAEEAGLQLERCRELLEQCRRDASLASEHSDQRLAQAAERLKELEETRQRLEQQASQVEAQLEQKQKQCSELEQALHLATERQEALTAELGGALSEASTTAAERGEQNAVLQRDRDELADQLAAAREELAAARATEATLRSEQGTLQLDLAQAQQALRDASLCMTQKVARYEGQQADLQDALSLARRELEATSRSTRRTEQQAADLQAELRSTREAHENVVGSLRRELRSKEEQLQFLNAHLQCIEVDSRPSQTAGPVVASHLDSLLPDGVRGVDLSRVAATTTSTPKPAAWSDGPVASAARRRANLSDLIQAYDQGTAGQQPRSDLLPSLQGATWKAAMADAARDLPSPLL